MGGAYDQDVTPSAKQMGLQLALNKINILFNSRFSPHHFEFCDGGLSLVQRVPQGARMVNFNPISSMSDEMGS